MATSESATRPDAQMAIRRMLALSAAIEGATGFALIIVPALVANLLLGQGVAGAGMGVARVAGVALLALALACWPDRGDVGGRTPGLRALLCYNLLVTLYLLRVGLASDSVALLLWPAVAVHALFTFLFARAWFTARPAAVRE